MADEAHLKRLRMRSWRRGIKEMDLILGPWADVSLGDLSPEELECYEALLNENDHDLYQWVTSRIGKLPQQATGPSAYGALLGVIATFAETRFVR